MQRLAAALSPQLFAHAHDAFIALDAAGAVTAWSPAAERLYGYAAAEVVGRTLDFLRIPEAASLPADSAAPAPGAGERLVRQRHKSGRELQVSLRMAPLGDGSGLLLCAADVSRMRQVETELAGSRTALEGSRAELRRVIGRLVTAEEEARRRISQELHDDLCQRLAALALGLKAVRRQLPEGDSRRRELDELGGDLGNAAEDLRRLSHDLHPAILERRGLADALRDHCEEVERRCSLPVRFTLQGARGGIVSLPSALSLGLFRIAQEALANAVRHAGAQEVHVALEIEAEAVYLSVADDGGGFEPEEVRRRGGLGLAGIDERAQLLGGRCRITSATGAGTEVRVFVPLPAPRTVTPLAVESPRLPHVGPYRLLGTIGTGSTATVYQAQEPEPLGRRVALKLHRAPLPGRWATLRFKAEQQALARLHHPAIAQVYEARTTDEDDLYIAMEYVAGLPITEYCDRYSLDLRRRLQLFAAVCDGVQHAHQKGVLHRDLKPSHILITEDAEEGGRPYPKIIDFGAAKGIDRPLADGTVWSTEGLVGTPAYLPPEALGGGETDARSDVYALGVVLYELLAGTVPIVLGGKPGATGSAAIADIAKWVEAVRRGDLVPPSQRLRTLADAARVARCRGFDDPAKLRRRLAGDLDRLVLKALAPQPAARYPTVEALGREVGRALRGVPVEAGPPGALHQIRRLLHRRRRLVASAALVILALAGGLAATTIQSRRAAAEAARADAAARFLEDLFKASDPRQALGAPLTARELLRRGTERLGQGLHGQPLLRARLLDTLGGSTPSSASSTRPGRCSPRRWRSARGSAAPGIRRSPTPWSAWDRWRASRAAATPCRSSAGRSPSARPASAPRAPGSPRCSTTSARPMPRKGISTWRRAPCGVPWPSSSACGEGATHGSPRSCTTFRGLPSTAAGWSSPSGSSGAPWRSARRLSPPTTSIWPAAGRPWRCCSGSRDSRRRRRLSSSAWRPPSRRSTAPTIRASPRPSSTSASSAPTSETRQPPAASSSAPSPSTSRPWLPATRSACAPSTSSPTSTASTGATPRPSPSTGSCWPSTTRG